MNPLKDLAFQIQVNRERLHWATVSRNQSLIDRTLLLLTRLHAAYFDATRKVVPMTNKETMYLVFSDQYPDGTVLSAVQYRALKKTMDQCDLNTHQAIEVDREMAGATEQALLLDKADKQSA